MLLALEDICGREVWTKSQVGGIVCLRQVRRFGLQLLTGRQRFRDYDRNLDPSIPNSMSAAALRFGHSTVRNTFSRVAENNRRFQSLWVKEFHNPEFLYDVDNGGIDSIIRGLFTDPAQNIDP